MKPNQELAARQAAADAIEGYPRSPRRALALARELFHCSACELVYLGRDTEPYYAPGCFTRSGARGCPVCATRLTRIGNPDLSVVDHLAARG